MHRVMLVDTMGSAYIHFHRKEANFAPTFISNLTTIAERFKVDAVYLLKEGGSYNRAKLLPTYKAARKEARAKKSASEQAAYKKFLEKMDFVSEVCSMLGIPSLRHGGAEADDLAGYLCSLLPSDDYQILLMTEDSDWHQLLERPNTVVGSYRKMTRHIDELGKDDWMNHTGFINAHELTPNQMFEVKMLTGDTSDSIPGIPGIGEVGAKRIISLYGTLAAAVEDAYNIDLPRFTAKAKEALATGQETLDLGYKLMNLRWSVEDWHKMLDKKVDASIKQGIEQAQFDGNAFKEVCYSEGWLFLAEDEWLEKHQNRKNVIDTDLFTC